MKQPFCAPSEALRRVLDAAAALPRPETETVPLDEADGRIAAGTLSARMDQPPFDRSPFDGYALHSADAAGASRETPVTLPVTMKLYAGDAPASPLPAGCAARIMTGAPLPEGADCVLMQELTDSGEETVQLYAAMKPQQNVVFRGGDIAAGAVIAEAGTVLSPAHLGVLAGQGYAEVPVYKTLTVGVLATGSELLAPGEAWTPGKIYDANGVQNAARLRQLVESGALGRVTMVQAVNNVPYGSVYYHSWYRDPSLTGGLFLQKTTHDIDYICHAAGLTPKRVFAHTEKLYYKGDRPAGLHCPDCPDYRTCVESSYVVGKLRGEDVQGDWLSSLADAIEGK